jgi:hypothetical protein
MAMPPVMPTHLVSAATVPNCAIVATKDRRMRWAVRLRHANDDAVMGG